MKWLITILLVMLGSTLQAKPNFEFDFDIKYSFEGSSHGRSYENIFNTTGLLNGLRDRFGSSGSYWTATSISISDIDQTLKLIKSLDKLNSSPDEGVLTKSAFQLRANFRHVFKTHDELSIAYSTSARTHLYSYINMSSLFGYRLFENSSGISWLQDIDILVSAFGQKEPPVGNKAAWNWVSQLESIGYTSTQAKLLAWLGARNGIDFDGLSGDLLLDFLENSLNGTGTSLESGASPLDNNSSGMRRMSLLMQEISVEYKCPINDWFVLGGAVRYMQGTFLSDFAGIHDLIYNGSNIVSSALLNDTTQSLNPSLAKTRNFGLDAFVLLSPVKGVSFSVSGHNLNAPRFKWENYVAYIDPQFTLGFEYRPVDFPFYASISIDVNRARDLLLPNYYNQLFQTKAGVNPEWENGGFSIGLSISRNIAESNEPFLYGLDIGVRIYAFKMNFGGESSIQSVTFPGISIPERFNFYATLGVQFKW